MPVIEGGQVLRGGQDFGGVLGGQVLYGGQEIEPEQGGRTQPDSEAVEMSVGPFRRSGAPPDGWYNGVADKGATAVDIVTGTHYTNTGTKAATVWTAASGGGSGLRTDRSGITIPAGGGWTVVPFSAGTEDFNTAGFALADNGAGVDIYQFPTAGIYDVTILVHVSAQANAGGSTVSLRTPNGVVDYHVPAAPFTILWADLVNVPSDDFDLALRLANDGEADVETDEIVLAARRV